ncbi:MAG: hypothetical protein NT072_12525 [Deltaproteobacteria bacterium]|nr:hypothetical protein [Deltaproteobacteria bacterium]
MHRKSGSVITASIILFLILLLIYSNSFRSDWHFDDYYNIVNNIHVHMKALTWSSLEQATLGPDGGRNMRPLPYLTFAFNYYFGNDNVFGYHLVNFSIHVLTTVFLYLFIYTMLNLPLLRERFGLRSRETAFLATLLWTISPVHVTAVSYVVQRIALMSALFYIMAMFFYVKGRTAESGIGKTAFFMLCMMSALLALVSKQNAAILPVSIFLFDLFFLQGLTSDNIRKNLYIFGIICLIVIALGAYYTNFSSILNGYSQRPFTLTERLLTESRIIVYYISLLLYPADYRLTFLHDVELSRSLFNPWSTLPAILFICMSVGWSLYAVRRHTLISYCILFFFLNHSIESSVLPLELIFEHRNYLPSMLLFVPVSYGILMAIDYFRNRKSLVFLLAAGMAFVIVMEGHTTFARNNIMQNEESFWLDILEKSPNLSRPHGEIGKLLKQRGSPLAVDELNKALELGNYAIKGQENIYYSNLGNYYLMVADDPDMALYYYGKAKGPGVHGEELDGMALALLKKGDLEGAFENSWKANHVNPRNSSFHFNMGLILLKLNKPDDAMNEGFLSLSLKESDPKPLQIIGEAYFQKGDRSGAMEYWELYTRRNPENVFGLLALADLYLQYGEEEKLKQTILRIDNLCAASDVSVDELIAEVDKNAAFHVRIPTRDVFELLKIR